LQLTGRHIAALLGQLQSGYQSVAQRGKLNIQVIHMATGYHRTLSNVPGGYGHGWSQRRELRQLLLLLLVGHENIGRQIWLLDGVDRRTLLLLLVEVLLLLWLLILLVDGLLLGLLVLL